MPKTEKRRVLSYSNRKSDGAMLLDASTPETEAGAYLALFEHLEQHWYMYQNLKDPISEKPDLPEGHPVGCFCKSCEAARDEVKTAAGREAERKEQYAWYLRAKDGDADAARALLNAQKSDEYAQFHFVWVDTHQAKYAPDPYLSGEQNCGAAYLTSAGLYLWERHGKKAKYQLFSSKTKGLQELARAVQHYDMTSKEEVDLRDAEWKFPTRKPEVTEVDWVRHSFEVQADDKHYDKALALLKEGSIKPGKVVKIIQPVCAFHKREASRFIYPYG